MDFLVIDNMEKIERRSGIPPKRQPLKNPLSKQLKLAMTGKFEW
jgi:hypothetical protein